MAIVAGAESARSLQREVHVAAVGVGQPEVDDQRVRALAGVPERRRPVAHRHDLEARLAQAPGQPRPHRGVVLDDQHAMTRHRSVVHDAIFTPAIAADMTTT